MNNYKPFIFTPRNIRNHARKTRAIAIIPHTSVELNAPRARVGSRPGDTKNKSVNTYNPPANKRNDIITVIFVGGVQAI